MRCSIESPTSRRSAFRWLVRAMAEISASLCRRRTSRLSGASSCASCRRAWIPAGGGTTAATVKSGSFVVASQFDDTGPACPFPSAVVVFGRPASVKWWDGARGRSRMTSPRSPPGSSTPWRRGRAPRRREAARGVDRAGRLDGSHRGRRALWGEPWWVYDHRDDLGAIRLGEIGDGRRPWLRFDPAKVAAFFEQSEPRSGRASGTGTGPVQPEQHPGRTTRQPGRGDRTPP